MSDREMYWIGVGDIHEDIGNLKLVPGIAEAQGIIISGDLTNRGRRARAEELMQTALHLNETVYAQIGNMDYPEVSDYLTEAGMNIHATGVEIERGVGLMGVGLSTPTPFDTPSEVGEKEIGQWLEQAFAAVRGVEHLILVSHDPPYNTTTDLLPGGQHVGSRSVRDFIERVQPEVCLTGHIHEAVSRDTIGRTQVLNPGMLSLGGYVHISLTGGRLAAEIRHIGT